jgi:hypothetical protein
MAEHSLLNKKSASPSSCPLCRGEVVLRSTSNLFNKAAQGHEVIESLVAKGLVSWNDLPPTTQVRMLKVVRRYSEAANQGHAGAQNNLGLLYENGRGVTQDSTEAVFWYREAAEQGNISSQNTLGFALEKGRGVTQDLTEAVSWYRKAAE